MSDSQSSTAGEASSESWSSCSNNNCQQSEKQPEKAKIAMPCYRRIVLEPGKTYLYCTCGFSKEEGGAFCDGTCKTDENIKGWEPKEFTVKHFTTGGYSICLCKRTERAPFCDGSHINLDW